MLFPLVKELISTRARSLTPGVEIHVVTILTTQRSLAKDDGESLTKVSSVCPGLPSFGGGSHDPVDDEDSDSDPGFENSSSEPSQWLVCDSRRFHLLVSKDVDNRRIWKVNAASKLTNLPNETSPTR